MSQVVFVLLPGVHVLDVAGPAQVFDTAACFGRPYRLVYVAEREHVPSAQGLPLTASVRWPDLGADDLIVVPGWRASTLREGPAPGPSGVEYLRAHHAAGGTVVSVCAGADALGRAGLLDGRRCTTHHELQDELAARYPRATVVRDVLFTTDGRVMTSAGIASGIDLALHLLAVRHGPALAARVARDMVIYARRNGHEPQASAMLRHRSHVDDTVHRIQDLIDDRLAQPLPLAYLAARAGCQRTHPHPAVQPRHVRADAPALPAGATAGTRPAPDRQRIDGGGRGPRSGFRGRPDATAAPRPRSVTVSGVVRGGRAGCRGTAPPGR